LVTFTHPYGEAGMTDRFTRMWGRRSAGGGLRLRDKIRLMVRGGSLREKLVRMRKKLDKDVRYLEIELNKFKTMEGGLVRRLKKAVREGDKVIASALSNEIYNLRKIITMMDKIRACFEQISMRIGLMLRVGDVASGISDIRGMIRLITPLVGAMVPRFLNDVIEIDEVLTELMNETDMSLTEMFPSEPMSEEARQLLESVELAVRHEEELALPEGPSSTTLPRARRVGGGSP